MAVSPAHRFGQLIGAIVEAALEPVLREFAERHGLYLDKKGARPARRGRKKVSWRDLHGNTHDLDYVLERGGTDREIGIPVAFIESAWRTYSKHSRNKAQEIQGAIIPLVETFKREGPFYGVLLAGMFTDGSVRQLKSLGFQVVYFSHAEIARAFQLVGIDTEWGEGASDAELAQRGVALEALTQAEREQVGSALRCGKREDLRHFLDALEGAVSRHVTFVRVTTLHGHLKECASVEQALEFVEQYPETNLLAPFVRYEVELHYNNGDHLRGCFSEKAHALGYLRNFLPRTVAPQGG